MRFLALLAVIAALATGGCSSTGGLPANVTQAFGVLSDFTLNDLRKAEALAEASGDKVGEACYSFLIPLAEKQAAGEGDLKLGGVATVLERGRIARMSLMAGSGAASGPCSALIREEVAFGVMVAGKLGLGVATGGGSSFLGLLGL